ncbi:unnamed protein product [Pleuronectes platessa]|uniref:TNFR-Cys domain-containing protein n=1 Tax=Pleuronectes platessa TaxID=8262 RepID=A0A9N7Z7A1_PLEPL|nr:unnamed protein product [Pleuronectes platessa]
MAPDALCALCGLILAAVANLHVASAQKSQCGRSEFWNSDLDMCVQCASCKQYPKTPSCNTCIPAEVTPDVPTNCLYVNPLKKLRGHYIKLKHFTSSSSGNRCDGTEQRPGSQLDAGTSGPRSEYSDQYLPTRIGPQESNECNTASAFCWAAVPSPATLQGDKGSPCRLSTTTASSR